MTIDIIGAGIGGLTTAIALQQNGMKTRVFEQSREIKPVGAGIILANNAMQVYEKLGLREEIEKNGNAISSMNITDAQLKTISQVDLRYFEEKHGVQNIAIHRGKLQQVLMNQFGADGVILDRKLIALHKGDSGYISEFENGSSVTSEILVGADGLHSKVRSSLFPERSVRNAYQVCWRGIADFSLPEQYQNELNEAWGLGDRFGFVQIEPNRVYWYALKSFKESYTEYSTDQLPIYFERYARIVGEIIKKTPVEAIHTAVISDLKPISKWYSENVCLIGDAAHATTPNMGQGACQAIEDAYVLAACLQKFEPPQAFANYQHLRLPKAHQVVNMSWTLGKLAHWKNPLAIQCRNQLMKMTPSSISRKQSERIFQLKTV